jgi:hypothetical protein
MQSGGRGRARVASESRPLRSSGRAALELMLAQTKRRSCGLALGRVPVCAANSPRGIGRGLSKIEPGLEAFLT